MRCGRRRTRPERPLALTVRSDDDERGFGDGSTERRITTRTRSVDDSPLPPPRFETGTFSLSLSAPGGQHGGGDRRARRLPERGKRTPPPAGSRSRVQFRRRGCRAFGPDLSRTRRHRAARLSNGDRDATPSPTAAAAARAPHTARARARTRPNKKNARARGVAQFVELAVQTHLPASGGAGLSALSRNHINALTADVIVALPGGPGTASEVVVEINGVMSRKRRSHD